MKKFASIMICGVALATTASYAQPPAEYKFIPSAEQKLVPQPNGLTSQFMLADLKSGTAMVTSRDKSGLAELHADWVDHIFVQAGGATMVLGGKVDEPRETGPGETRGSGVTGGKSFAMHPGDYVYVPANTAHRMVLAPGQTIRYAVVKAHN
jgi:glyoxylate utilization-related uncharacterized protein